MYQSIRLGRRTLVSGALALLIYSVWALRTRLDTLHRPLNMFFEMARGEGIALNAAMRYFDWGIFHVPTRLTAEALLALLALALRKRPFAGFFLIPACGTLAGWSILSGDAVLALPGSLVECVPLALMALGSLGQLVARLCLPRETIAVMAPAPTLASAPRLRRLSAPHPNPAGHAKPLNEYRICKYDPRFRINGVYTKDEWTSASDVGKTFDGSILTKEECRRVIDGYIQSIREILRRSSPEGLPPLCINGLEKGSKLPWTEGQLLTEDHIAQLIQDCLTEKCWCKITGTDFFIHFGYDLYVYLGCRLDRRTVAEIAGAHGLFADPFVSPYHCTEKS